MYDDRVLVSHGGEMNGGDMSFNFSTPAEPVELLRPEG